MHAYWIDHDKMCVCNAMSTTTEQRIIKGPIKKKKHVLKYIYLTQLSVSKGNMDEIFPELSCIESTQFCANE